MTAEYVVSVRDSTGTEVAQLEGWTKLEVVLRHNLPGSWLLEGISADDPASLYLRPGAGLVIRRDGEVLTSGPIDYPRRQRSRKANKVDVSGPDDLVNLWDRIVFPDPANNAAAWATDYDVATGPAETVIHHFVEVNAGPSALPARRVAGLTLGVDLGRGSDVTGRGRMHLNLGEFVSGLALAGGDLGLAVVQAAEGGGPVFSVYAPRDLTATVVFAESLENLDGYSYEERIAGANYLVVGGGGEGVARTFVEGGDSASIVQWGRRVEAFVDQRQTVDLLELAQKRDEELANQAGQLKATLDVRNTPSLAFGSDYGLGDRVTVVADIGSLTQIIREVTIVRDAKGETVKPTMATPGGLSLGLGFVERSRRLEARMANVEGV